MAILNGILIMITIGGVLLYITSSVLIYGFLKYRNDKTPNYMQVSISMLEYMKKYKRITKGEKRRVGGLYYLWFASIGLAFAGVILLLILNALT